MRRTNSRPNRQRKARRREPVSTTEIKYAHAKRAEEDAEKFVRGYDAESRLMQETRRNVVEQMIVVCECQPEIKLTRNEFTIAIKKSTIIINFIEMIGD